MSNKITINNEDRDKLVEIFQETKVENYIHDISAEFALFTKLLKLKAIRENYQFEEYVKILNYFKQHGLYLYVKQTTKSTPSSTLYAFLSHAFQHPELALDPNHTINLRKKDTNKVISPQTIEDTESTFKNLREQFMQDIETFADQKKKIYDFEDLDVNNNTIGCPKCISGYKQNDDGQWQFCECYMKQLLVTKYRNAGIKNNYINISSIDETLIDFVAKKSFASNKDKFKGETLTHFLNKYTENIDNLLFNGWNLIIEGPTGTLKTTTATLIGKYAIRKNYSVLFTEMQQLRKIWVSEKLTPRLEFVKNNLYNCDLLIIDDFGQEFMSSNSDFQIAELDNLLRERNSMNKSVIITTNATQDNLRQRYGERIYSLLNEKTIHLYIKTKIDVRNNEVLPDFLD